MERVVVDAAQKRVLQIAAAIEAYLAEHPGAADTEQGIRDWWLPARGIAAGDGELHAALAQLVAARRVEAHRLPDGTVIYRAARAAAQP